MTERFDTNVSHFFHGTNDEYVMRQISLYGKYRHEDVNNAPLPVFVTNSRARARGYAFNQSREFGGEPYIIAVRTELILPRLRLSDCRTEYVLDYILEEEFDEVLMRNPVC